MQPVNWGGRLTVGEVTCLPICDSRCGFFAVSPPTRPRSLTVALGIGANTAVFSILDASLLKPLPFRDPGQLVDIREVQGKGTAEERVISGMTRVRLEEWRAHTHIFSGIEADRDARAVSLAEGDATVNLAEISPGLFPLLGLEPILGRGLTSDDADDALLIVEGFWGRRFAGNRSVIGRSIVLDGKTYTVVGVMPANARYPLGPSIDAWTRLPGSGRSQASGFRFHRRDREVATRVVVDVCPAGARRGGRSDPIRASRPEPWAANLDPINSRTILGSSNAIVTMAFAAVALVLLTACANVAMLLLGRGWSRQRELAIRRALGAGRWRMARLLLMEGVLLSAAGGTLGIVIAPWLVAALPAVMPAHLIFFSAHDVEMTAASLYSRWPRPSSSPPSAVSHPRCEIPRRGVRRRLGADGAFARLVAADTRP